jgi:hypothetical protein
VKILDTLTLTRSAARSAAWQREFVMFICIYVFVKKKFNEERGSIKPYNVDSSGKGWTVLVGYEIGLVDVQKE